MNKIELLGRQREKGRTHAGSRWSTKDSPNVWIFVGMNGELHRLGGQIPCEKDNNLLGIAHGCVKLLQQPLVLFLTSEMGVV